MFYSSSFFTAVCLFITINIYYPLMVTFEELSDLLKSDRSIRRFDESREISEDILINLVGLTRFCSSGRNMQPLRYRIVTSHEMREKIYPLLAWAGYLKDWAGPQKGERPAAYLIQCLDTTYGENCLCDDGLQLEAIRLGARTGGIGSCIIKAFNAPEVKRVLNLNENLVPRYVLAMGYPAEEPVIEDTDGTADADIKYYRTADDTLHVPKRPLPELLV